MKDRLEWDELRLFLAVARASGLNGAARATAVSAPTLGRRMTALEQRIAQRLFVRRQTGYTLTDAGQALYAHALDMEAVATGIERWREGNAPRRIVRISAGSWTSRFLAAHVDALWHSEPAIGIEIATAHQRVDILRRQADIGVRTLPPDEPRIAGRRMNKVAHAIYRGIGAPDDLPWILLSGDAGVIAPARWASRHHASHAAIVVSDPRTIPDCLRRGVAQAVIPCFAGDVEPGIERVGEPIGEIEEQQWLALNEQSRREPAVRSVIDRLVALLEANQALFLGERPASSGNFPALKP
jgi:DNA-binding transcriptional LysR family regulator